jgi:ATP-dependent protease ClpP protease subunit
VAGEADVFLYDEIGYWGIWAEDVIRQLAGITAPVINLKVNSPGGCVFDGLAIMNALADHPATVNVVVDGLAASAASFIAMAGDTITMNRGASLMIHDASGTCLGNASDMGEMAELLDKISDTIAGLYAERAGGTPGEWRSLMVAETWFNAAEAVTAGLADQAVTATPAPAANAPAFDLTCFHHAGRDHAPAPSIPAPIPEPEPEPAVFDGAAFRDVMRGAFSD